MRLQHDEDVEHWKFRRQCVRAIDTLMSSKDFGDKRVRRGKWIWDVMPLADAVMYVAPKTPESFEPIALWDLFTCPGMPQASFCYYGSAPHSAHVVTLAMGTCRNCGDRYQLSTAIGHHGFCTDWCMRRYERRQVDD